MSVEAGLYSYLSTRPAITALVSTRIYPMRLPPGATTPAVVYWRIPEPGQYRRSHSGSSNLAHPRLQVDTWAGTYGEAKSVAGALRAALDNYVGTMGDVEVQACFLENEFDTFDPEALLHRVIQEYIIWHQPD